MKVIERCDWMYWPWPFTLALCDAAEGIPAWQVSHFKPRQPSPKPDDAKESMVNTIARFFDWLAAGVAEGERLRSEAYLAQAADHCDLELRLRELEHEPSRGGW